MRLASLSSLMLIASLSLVTRAENPPAQNKPPFDPVDIVKLRQEADAAAEAADRAAAAKRAADKIQADTHGAGAPNDVIADGVQLLIMTQPQQMEKVAFLGVGIESPDALLREQNHIPAETGLLINRVEPDSAAAAAGLQVGDIVQKLNDQLLINPEQLVVLIRSFNPDDQITLSILRNAEQKRVTVKLGRREIPVTNQAAPAAGVPFVLDRMVAQGNVLVTHRVNPNNNDLLIQVRTDGVVDIANQTPNDKPEPTGRVESITWTDGEHAFEVTAKATGARHELHLVLRNAEGTVLFDGPIDTPDDLKSLPADALEKLNQPALRPLLDSMRAQLQQRGR